MVYVSQIASFTGAVRDWAEGTRVVFVAQGASSRGLQVGRPSQLDSGFKSV